jgi:hypothetical protein
MTSRLIRKSLARARALASSRSLPLPSLFFSVRYPEPRGVGRKSEAASAADQREEIVDIVFITTNSARGEHLRERLTLDERRNNEPPFGPR